MHQMNLIIADTYPLSEKRILKSKRKYLTIPQNTMNIANNAFKLGERGNLDEVIVFQQNKNGNLRRFEKKGKCVYRR